MVVQEDPALPSSQRHTESTPPYGAIPPKKEPMASTQQTTEGPHEKEEIWRHSNSWNPNPNATTCSRDAYH